MAKKIYYVSAKLFFLCLVVTSITSKSNAQTVNGDSVVLLSLLQAIDLGVKNSYKLKSANLAVEISNENIKNEKTNRLPDINLGIDGYLINDPTLYNKSLFQDPERIDYTPYQVSGNLVISEVIYGGKRIKNSINQEILQRKITEFSLARTAADVKMAIIQEYLRLYNLLKDYEITVKTINQIDLRLKTLRSKFLHGQVVKNDVSRSELQKSDFELKLLHTISNASATNYFLTLLLGLNENTTIQVDTTFNYTADTLFVFDDCLVTAFNNRSEYQIAQTNRELSENALKLIKGAYHPTVNGVGLYGLQNPVPGTFPPEGKFLSFFTVGVGINYNLGSFYKLKHRKLSSALAIQREQENIKDLQIALSDEVRTQLAQYEVQRQSLNIFIKKIHFAEENYRIIQSRYYNDLALISDIVDAELEYNQARLDLVQGQVQTRINYYRVMKAIGKL
jgi:outer membrane protein TolC